MCNRARSAPAEGGTRTCEMGSSAENTLARPTPVKVAGESRDSDVARGDVVVRAIAHIVFQMVNSQFLQYRPVPARSLEATDFHNI